MLLCFCVLFCALSVILSLLLVIMGGQHDGLFLSGSPPILYIYIHMYIFLIANKLCCCCSIAPLHSERWKVKGQGHNSAEIVFRWQPTVPVCIPGRVCLLCGALHCISSCCLFIVYLTGSVKWRSVGAIKDSNQHLHLNWYTYSLGGSHRPTMAKQPVWGID